ncbi:hypothetical protein Ssi03_16280 [Sphaerisporangium siamense]|uniref:DUF6286 domain-containing protein n=1 Tax=Sphaerisporangium siamense TaxID=795645 RepID=A0A7W7GBN2_9ACTN|nr:DUF6286 domain-containing protein [Sphaerisporangium siamense]MBB4702609.1 hypothetical protein [Sphaerisporangium siamense]GII83638.1 hypothetical protein Ssi03_16280 [Sphaerisporangium siamense]
MTTPGDPTAPWPGHGTSPDEPAGSWTGQASPGDATGSSAGHGTSPGDPTASGPEPSSAPEFPEGPAEEPPVRHGVARRAAARAFRPRRAISATVTALLLSLAALLTLAGAVSAATGTDMRMPPWSWLADFAAGPVDDPGHLAAASGALALGLFLLGLAFVPGRARVVPLAPDDPMTVTAITRGGLRRHLATVAEGVDGVSRARVRVGRHAVRVNATTPLREPAGLPGEVTEAVGDRLDELRPLRPLRVHVDVRRKEG